jgi:hypothetical protein
MRNQFALRNTSLTHLSCSEESCRMMDGHFSEPIPKFPEEPFNQKQTDLAVCDCR